MDKLDLVDLAAEIVTAHVSNNSVAIGDMPDLIREVHSALAKLTQQPDEPPIGETAPVVSVRASVKPDYIICMACGRKQKTMRRHIRTAHDLTPEQYRKDYGLPDSYPLTAPNYSDRRRDLAKSIGLGRKPGEKTSATTRKKVVAEGR